MYLEFLKWLFIIASGILGVMFVLLEINFTKKMEPMKASEFVSAIAAGLFVYIILAITLATTQTRILKFILLSFAIFPFVLGQFATYKTRKCFTLIQILVIISSVVYTLHI